MINILFTHEDRKTEILQRAISFSIQRQYLELTQKSPIEILSVNIDSRSISQKLSFVIWYLAWTVKWFLLFGKQNNSKIITTSLFTDIKSSLHTLVVLKEIAFENDAVIVHYGVLPKWGFLFSCNIFCHPFHVFRLLFNKNESNYDFDILSLNKELLKEFNESRMLIIKNDLERLRKYYSEVNRHLSKLLLKHKILFYISDLDNIDTRSILCELHRDYHVITFLIDHSINTFSQINRNIYSDHYLCWGDYHIDGYKKNVNGGIICKTTSKIGHPLKQYSIGNTKKGKKWVYFLPSFQHQTALSYSRNIMTTFDQLIRIQNIISSTFIDRELSIKQHPIDMIDFSEVFNIKQMDTVKGNKYEGIEIAFIEDSTIAIELLQYDIPIVYVANSKGEDLLKLSHMGCAYILKMGDDIEEIIKKVLKSQCDMASRKKAFEYYFDVYDEYWSKFREEIKKYSFPTN